MENLNETFYVYEDEQNNIFIDRKSNKSYLGNLVGNFKGTLTNEPVNVSKEDTTLKEGQIVALSDSGNVKIEYIELNS